MIEVRQQPATVYKVECISSLSTVYERLSQEIQQVFKANPLEIMYIPSRETILYIGLGELKSYDKVFIKEVLAKAAKEMKRLGHTIFSVEMGKLIEVFGLEVIKDAVEGMILGLYEGLTYKTNVAKVEYQIDFYGIQEDYKERARKLVDEYSVLTQGVIFARHMVNKPGNLLRPYDFVQAIKELVKDTSIEIDCFDYDALQEMGMKALVVVGESSSYRPYFLVMRYKGENTSKEITGLVGKGVTCDTGGYCLKAANSMLGIKGDMAGAAAVVGAMYALATNKVETNVIACLPICENRISSGSMLPGDVIGSFSGKTIEVLNTDAEGRLILADAVSYAVQKEQVSKVLDIATLTGAVVNLLGFSIAGVMTDNQRLWDNFARAYNQSGERYLRLPYYKEHKKMIESKIADIKNMGESYCGTLTAGLFIREFADGIPWLHVDIAGTAWVDSPVFEYQSKGATGAGVTSLYHFCKEV